MYNFWKKIYFIHFDTFIHFDMYLTYIFFPCGTTWTWSLTAGFWGGRLVSQVKKIEFFFLLITSKTYPTWKNIYVTYILKYMKYIFAKTCIIRIYLAYIFLDIFAKIYLTYIIPRPSKYIFMPKSCVSRIYISYSWGV